MGTFLDLYGFLIISILQQALLGYSLYFPLMAGQLSLASIGFYSLGGYVAAIMGTHPAFTAWRAALGWCMYPVEWLFALALSVVLGVAVGFPALRLRGIYLALATIAFVQVVNVVVLNMPIAGGAVGIFGIPQAFDSRIAYFWFFGPLLLLTLVFVTRLERVGAGRDFMSIREDELAAGAMGVRTTRSKVAAFTIGCAVAGVTGAMSAPFLNTWNARQGTFDASVACLAYVLIGGSRSKWGPLLGAALLVALPEVLRPLRDSRLILNGLVLVLACVYLPRGLAGITLRRKPEGEGA
ncbi:ABC-type transporter, integral membrane subunit [Desulfovibrio sp. X2]|uniref:branched-chain amino acid ABC transporter permease n=1 Tax=Desulfovibrio sp. X2 TaxID=941449 RepID=UPI000358ABE7|nr:branched-chain amino acid ABC transporter permease [Desulfovibrio sp. X2]EPR42186.1 ABC-type transporter, integral membrane subunit [Desulfovibrio sp. X2]